MLARSRSQTAYRQRISERLGLLPKNFQSGGIILHAASVGEVLALRPFVEKLLTDDPTLIITFTTFTPTGSAQVKKLFNDRVQHCYLPLDCWPFTWLFLKQLQPKAFIFMETELWPNLVAQCHSKKIKLLLINARLSDKSVRHYQGLSWLIAPCLTKFDAILCQSQANAERFISLGAPQSKTVVSGNLKYDISASNDVLTKTKQLASLIQGKRTLLVAASTHEGDEQLAIDVFNQLKKRNEKLLLVIVPRHPERFEQIAQLAQRHGTIARRSLNQAVTNETAIWVIDTLGELLSVYALADITIIGGSFSTIGGHNPLEPALFGCPIIVGPDMSNFVDITEQLIKGGGLWQMPAQSNLTNDIVEHCQQLLSDSEKAKEFGKLGQQVVLANQGATQKTIDTLISLLND